METKKQNTVKIAAKNIKEPEPVEETANNKAVSEEPAQENIPQSLNEILSKVDPTQVEIVNNLVPGLIPYLSLQEQKVNWLIKNMPTEDGVKKAFIDVINQQTQTATGQTQQVGGGVNLQQLLGLMAQMGLSGGGGDSEFATLGKELLQVQIQNMKAESDFTRSIKNAIVSKLVGSAVAGVV